MTQIVSAESATNTLKLVTFIIPAHNAAETLVKAITSLQKQTITTWEAVIVDDGSTDETLALARQLAAGDARLRVLSQAQGGESAARNAGIDAVRGEAVTFLDADDWLLPAYLERMLPALAADPTLDGVHCGHYCVTPDGQRGPDSFPWWTSDLFEELSRRNPFAIHTCLVRQALVKAVGHFDTRLRTAPDWDFWQRAARMGARFGAVPEALACYLVRPGSATSNAPQILVDCLTVIARGHQPDPRVRQPDARYAHGVPAERAPQAKLHFACWAAGLAIGQGQDGRTLLAKVPDEGQPKLLPEAVASHLFDAVPWPRGQLETAWPALWPKVAGPVADFLSALEARGSTPGLAEAAALKLEALVYPRPPAKKPHPGGDGPDALQRYVAELETAKAWLEQHAASWQRVARERDEEIHALQAWIEELETAKTWLDEQRQNWMRRAEAAELQLRRTVPLAWPKWLKPDVWHEKEITSPEGVAREAGETGSFEGPDDTTEELAVGEQAVSVEAHTTEAEGQTGQPARTGATPEQTPEPSRAEVVAEAGPFARQRQVRPLSRAWGYDRGTPIDRHYIEGFLARQAADVRGRVLEVGDNSYTLRYGGPRVTQSDVLNVAPGHPQTTFVADLAHGDKLPSDAFDCVILTQTLHLIYDTRAALQTAARILQPGGVLLLTCPGLTRTSQTEWPGTWFWRFTPASLTRLLAEAAPELEAEVEQHGNVLAASAFLYGLAVEELSAAELDELDPEYDVILAVRAVKRSGETKETQRRSSHRAGNAVWPPATVDGPAQARLASVERTVAEARGLVLLYHRIERAEVDPWAITVSPDHFEAQMQVLKRVFEPVRLSDLPQALERPSGARPPVAVTFDDGYADNLYAALPVLERYAVPATFFIATGGVAARAEFWWDTLERVLLRPGRLPGTLRLSVEGQPQSWALGEWAAYSQADWAAHLAWRAWETPPTPRHAVYAQLWALLHPLPPEAVRAAVAEVAQWAEAGDEPKQRVMGLDELRQLAASGLADLGGHTVRHPSLAALPPAAQRAEIEDGRRWLVEAVGQPVQAFAYPFGKPGDYGPETAALVRSVGFEVGVVNTAGVVRRETEPLQWPRLHVGDWETEVFERELWRVMESSVD